MPAGLSAAGAGPQAAHPGHGVLIDQRPVEVQMRLIPGHWEGDLIIGKGNLSQVGTLVERTTLFVALVKLDSSKADVTAEAFTEILNRFDSQLRRSMTYDQGPEMRHHKTLTRDTGVDVYFCFIPTLPGSAASAKTPTACSASTCPRAPTCRCSPRSNSTISHGGSTPGLEKPWDGKRPQNSSSRKEPSTSCNTGHR